MLRERGLRGGAMFYDAQCDDARLTLATARSAIQHGALVANYVAVVGLERTAGRVVGAQVEDRLPAVPAEPRLPAPLPVRAAPMVAERAVAPSNGEVRPAVGPTASQFESRPTEGTRPAPEARTALPEAQATGRGPTQAPIATPASTSAAPAVASRAASPEAREIPRGTAAAAQPTPAPRAQPVEALGSIGVPQAEAATVRTAAPPLPTWRRRRVSPRPPSRAFSTIASGC